ncbi:MAG: CDP-diacylglycerol--glycerol-3-phosphate 3-phosphatidyltransferase [Oscillospiraceae bacterium]|jgi:CDP-diacylglycerol--glycerol-3-phosphate 3-phosphatidyltransferase|nr:CDP-diacylglycerol--glycerol-3-phosphate 3-phosphatidyltransferase [Oscillospiraceae bacterium]
MNIANKLTIFRVILVPFFMLPFYLPQSGTEHFSYNAMAAVMFFSAAGLTDILDGYYARSKNMVTTFGKFLDPLADKILSTAALCVFIEEGLFTAIPVMIILAREFAVSGLRLVVANEGVTVPASLAGKLKTIFTSTTIIITLSSMVFKIVDNMNPLLQILMWITVILTIFSGLDYFKAFAPYINSNHTEEHMEYVDEGAEGADEDEGDDDSGVAEVIIIKSSDVEKDETEIIKSTDKDDFNEKNS